MSGSLLAFSHMTDATFPYLPEEAPSFIIPEDRFLQVLHPTGIMPDEFLGSKLRFAA